MNIDENMRNKGKYRIIKGVYLQNDSYLSFQLPYRSKLGTISNNIILFSFELKKKSIRFIAAKI